MMYLLLFGLTALVVVLPMLPALMEWWRPGDVVPLFIDNDDSLDPPFLARSFHSRLNTALALGKTKLGDSPIVTLSLPGPWSLDDNERKAGASRRVWNVVGDAVLPADISFLAEVAAGGTVQTAAGCAYRALWAGQHLQFAPKSQVLRWAHAPHVTVGSGCQLEGRVTAERCIDIGPKTRFNLLNAPVVRFSPLRAARTEVQQETFQKLREGLQAPVRWNVAAARGICDESLKIGRRNAWRGDLVCAGDLWLGENCKVHGSLKSRGLLTLEAGCAVSGSIVATGVVELAADCVAQGSIISETAIVLGAGCVIGTPERPCTVAAPVIEVAGGVVVHGTLWAGERGLCRSADLAPVPAPAAAPTSSGAAFTPLREQGATA